MTDIERLTARVVDRFWAKVEKGDGCWLWTGNVAGGGYGRFYPGKPGPVSIAAHRFAYEVEVGPIPDGLVLDHTCRVRLCVNPAHLDAVTQRENVIRSEGLIADQLRQTHCKRGHPLSGSNLYIYKTERHCRTCRRAERIAREARERVA